MKVMNTLILSVLTPIFFARLITPIEVDHSRTDLNCSNKEALHICYEHELQKIEYYRKLDARTYDKLRTICGCNCTIGRVIPMNPDPNDYYPSENHPGEYKKEFVCVNDSLYNPDLLLQICNTGELCQTDYLAPHGSETGDLTHVNETIPRCLCNRARECVANKNDTDDNVVKYYCQLKENDKDPHTCKGNEVYKVEWYVGTNVSYLGDKMDTDFKCKCEYERKISKLLDQEGYYSHYLNTTIRKYYCDKKPDRELEKCHDHQVVYRSYRYEYGKDRNDKTYEETEERYCNCPKEMKHSNRSIIPKSEWTKPYDQVWEERCMKPISKKLQKCQMNQVFQVKIQRLTLTTTPVPKTRVNTYIYCICEHKGKSERSEKVGEKDLWPDKFIEHQEIETTKCKISHWPKANESCKDYAICQEDGLDYTGMEEPGKFHTKFVTTYCRCDKKRVCVKVGRREHHGVHRCILPLKPGGEGNICKQGEVDLVRIEQKVIQHDGSAKQQRLNTFKRCSCKGNFINKVAPDEYTDDNHNHLIIKHKCEKDGEDKEVEPEYCVYEDVCKTEHYNNAGLENPDKKIYLNHTVNCNCTLPRNCIPLEPQYNLIKHKCHRGKVNEQKLHLCNGGENYKIEIYEGFDSPLFERNVSKRIVLKRNTILLCLCEHIFYKDIDVYEPDHVPEGRLTKYFPCPPRKYQKPKLNSCKDYTICRKEIYTEYGSFVGSGVKYLSHNFSTCECDRNRICNLTEEGHQTGEKTWTSYTNTYRCIHKEDLHDFNETALSPCKLHQKFLVVIREEKPNKPKERLNAYVKCKCNSQEHFEQHNIPSDGYYDPSDPHQSIDFYKCRKAPVGSKPFCKEGGLCFGKHYENCGRERGPRLFLSHHTQSCKCRPHQICKPNIIFSGDSLKISTCEVPEK